MIAALLLALAIDTTSLRERVRGLVAPPAVAEVLDAWSPDTTATFCIGEWDLHDDRLAILVLITATPGPVRCSGTPMLLQRAGCALEGAEMMEALGDDRPAWFLVMCSQSQFRIYEHTATRGRSA